MRPPPWGIEDQPPFVNCCVAIDTQLTPGGLVGTRCRRSSTRSGAARDQERRWRPRPIDIDILAYDDVVRDGGADLTLPHPRLFERAFVLVPLAEIVPERVIAGIRVRDALARIDTTGVRRLGPRPAS